jgi:hypothetical protein
MISSPKETYFTNCHFVKHFIKQSLALATPSNSLGLTQAMRGGRDNDRSFRWKEFFYIVLDKYQAGHDDSGY